MNKKNLILRLVGFMAVYFLFYAVPIVVINHTKHLPGRLDNLCFDLPDLAFPFNKIWWGDDMSLPYIFSERVAWLVTGLYLILLGLLFLKMTVRVQRFRWLVPLAFCFCVLSIILLNLVFEICGITVYFNVP